jgi:hypothetical protein
VINRNGAPVTAWPGSPACSTLFGVNSTTVTAGPNVTIDFAVAHDGAFKTPPQGTDPFFHFSPVCGPLTSVTYDRCQGD